MNEPRATESEIRNELEIAHEQLLERDQTISEHDQRLVERDQSITWRDQQIIDLQNENIALREAFDAVLATRAWRMAERLRRYRRVIFRRTA